MGFNMSNLPNTVSIEQRLCRSRLRRVSRSDAIMQVSLAGPAAAAEPIR